MRPTQRALSSGKVRRGWRGRTAASQRARFQAVCVASSWFWQSGVVSSRESAGMVPNPAHQRVPLTGCYANASRWAANFHRNGIQHTAVIVWIYNTEET